MQLLGSEHDLCKCKGADQRDSVAHEINVMLGKNQRLIDDKQGEHHKKIKRDYEVLAHLVNDFLLQRLLVMTHGICSSSGLDGPERLGLLWIPRKLEVTHVGANSPITSDTETRNLAGSRVIRLSSNYDYSQKKSP